MSYRGRYHDKSSSAFGYKTMICADHPEAIQKRVVGSSRLGSGRMVGNPEAIAIG
jgi:hypothetical protein